MEENMAIPAIRRQSATLLLIDVQEKLLAAMEPEKAPGFVKQVGTLVDGARVLGIPVVTTGQYPKGLGPTIAPLKEKLSEAPIEKVEFSAFANHQAREALVRRGSHSIIVCGMETHVCVYQTARDLIQYGFQVFLPRDAVLSRRELNVQAGLSLCERSGAILTSVEAVLFEMVGSAADPSFKEISKLIR
jgi:nicotinamidase-related amidase